MTSTRSDVELLRAHADGDREAFGELVHRHQDRLWAVALGTLRNPEDAADAVQDAWISAYRSATGFRGDAAVTTWLHRIVVNSCLDSLRRKKVRPVSPLPETGAAEPVDPRDPMAERDAEITIGDAMAELGDDQRAAITLVDLYGYSVAEAAVLLEVAEGTVKSRCARGRVQLARRLDRLPADPAPPDGNRPDHDNVQDRSDRDEPEGGLR